MRQSISRRFRRQAEFLRRQFLQDGGLPFTDVLSADLVCQALAAIGTAWYDRIYTPLVTLWLFLGQVLSPDHSCRAAVARLIAHRAARGQRPCSAADRGLLPGPPAAARGVRRGRRPSDRAGAGRRVRTRSGCGRAGGCTSTTGRTRPCRTRRRTRPSTRSRTPRSRASGSRWPGSAAVFSLACGAVLGAGHRPVRGQGAERAGAAPQAVGPVPPRRRRAGRPAHVRLDRDGHAQAARGRLRVPVHVPPEGRLPPRPSAGRGRPRRRVAQAAEAPVDRPARRTPHCPSP